MNSLRLIAAQNSGVNEGEDISAGVDHLNNLTAREECLEHYQRPRHLPVVKGRSIYKACILQSSGRSSLLSRDASAQHYSGSASMGNRSPRTCYFHFRLST